MRCSVRVAVAAAVLWGCRDAPPASEPPRQVAADSGALAAAQGAERDAGAVRVGELPDVEPVAFQIFDESVEEAPPRRVTLHMLVSTEADRDQLRATMTAALEEAAARDPDAVAIRAIGYRPEAVRENLGLIPFTWAEWLPNEGWYEATEDSRDGLHRIYFYHELAPEW